VNEESTDCDTPRRPRSSRTATRSSWPRCRVSTDSVRRSSTASGCSNSKSRHVRPAALLRRLGGDAVQPNDCAGSRHLRMKATRSRSSRLSNEAIRVSFFENVIEEVVLHPMTRKSRQGEELPLRRVHYHDTGPTRACAYRRQTQSNSRSSSRGKLLEAQRLRSRTSTTSRCSTNGLLRDRE